MFFLLSEAVKKGKKGKGRKKRKKKKGVLATRVTA
jgi:hypothetical protein